MIFNFQNFQSFRFEKPEAIFGLFSRYHRACRAAFPKFLSYNTRWGMCMYALLESESICMWTSFTPLVRTESFNSCAKDKDRLTINKLTDYNESAFGHKHGSFHFFSVSINTFSDLKVFQHLIYAHYLTLTNHIWQKFCLKKWSFHFFLAISLQFTETRLDFSLFIFIIAGLIVALYWSIAEADIVCNKKFFPAHNIISTSTEIVFVDGYDLSKQV